MHKHPNVESLRIVHIYDSVYGYDPSPQSFRVALTDQGYYTGYNPFYWRVQNYAFIPILVTIYRYGWKQVSEALDIYDDSLCSHIEGCNLITLKEEHRYQLRLADEVRRNYGSSHGEKECECWPYCINKMNHDKECLKYEIPTLAWHQSRNGFIPLKPYKLASKTKWEDREPNEFKRIPIVEMNNTLKTVNSQGNMQD